MGLNTQYKINMTATKLNELKNITIMCIGSRGDFQPYLALALELKSAGYNVRLLSIITFQKFAQDFGIDFVVISDDCVDKTLRENEAMREAMASGDATKLAENAAADTLSNIRFTVETFFQEMTQHTPDLFIEGTLCEYYGHYAKHILNLPSMQVKLQAIVHNPDRAMMGLKVSRSQGLKVSRSQGLKVSRSQDHRVSRCQGLKVTRSQGVKVSRSQGPM